MSEPSEEKPDIKGEGGGEQLHLKVVTQDGTEVDFKVKKTTPLFKLMNAYCQRQAIDRKSVRFVTPEGTVVQDDMTATDLELEDGDSIDVMQEQTGGM
ncbi:hypothetical protein SARC_07057 [Sphaeroforma arctica JP610]|uniref:Ubiquitin-like domain-containing protein n=1 Tax=Sphaeroforma arctica JP610 TaxID=667725 RepID=A0A0L0FVM2_9EUKA|nr:hypothetical protein SARC_07057 [Sphaeroforma arctica JP610]KNC80586.1 hypothetical protein SARC_07057 [Sphaeroforma arctica JP610]|eukprot:XP_014154488.1 hypothetical protein SARC_07057 [Sphaeroforma arctica JP610]